MKILKDILQKILYYNCCSDIIETFIILRLVCNEWKNLIDNIITLFLSSYINIDYLGKIEQKKWFILILFIGQKTNIKVKTEPPYLNNNNEFNNIISLLPSPFLYKDIVIEINKFFISYLNNKKYSKNFIKLHELFFKPMTICSYNKCYRNKCIKFHSNYFKDKKISNIPLSYCNNKDVLYKKIKFIANVWNLPIKLIIEKLY